MPRDTPTPQTTEAPPMTVGQLVALLAAMPQDAPALIPGYEGDSTSIDGVKRVELVRDEKRQAWYYGEWREPEGDEKPTVAVKILGVRHAA